MASAHSANDDFKQECGICYDQLENNNIMMLPCCHGVCHDCFSKLISKNCPFCRYDFTTEYNELMRYNNDIQDNDVQDIDTFFNFNDFDNLDETITHHMRKINKRKKKRTHKHNTQNTNQSFNNSYNQIPLNTSNSQSYDLFDYHLIFNISNISDTSVNNSSNHSSYFNNCAHSQNNHLNFYKKRHIVYKNSNKHSCNRRNFHRSRNSC